MRWWFKKKPCMHLVINYSCSKVNSRCQFMLSNALHHKHILAHVPWVTQQILKVFIYMNKMLTLVCVDV